MNEKQPWIGYSNRWGLEFEDSPCGSCGHNTDGDIMNTDQCDDVGCDGEFSAWTPPDLGESPETTIMSGLTPKRMDIPGEPLDGAPPTEDRYPAVFPDDLEDEDDPDPDHCSCGEPGCPDVDFENVETPEDPMDKKLPHKDETLDKPKIAPYGKELILDLHECDPLTFTRMSIGNYFKELCILIDMERCDLHWWDDYGVPPEEHQTDYHSYPGPDEERLPQHILM